ncbi:hypothetical protein CBM2637_B110399 [Cupriavidus taiwanensis]|nr:hypothetical protein CBM2637_B110399 [Cupriavidus taiwanensis]
MSIPNFTFPVEEIVWFVFGQILA